MKRIIYVDLSLFLFLILIGNIVMPFSSGKAQPIRTSKNKEVKNSISEKKHIAIDGESIGMFIRGKDKEKPVLLFLGGGPGIPQMFVEDSMPSGIEDKFVVCYPEYRGTSLSYHSDISPKELTTQRYLEDVKKITSYLSQRFHQKKIYLMGHSFGTYIGLLAASESPESYLSFLSMSQVTDSEKSEKLAYQYMVDQYRSQKNEKMLKKMEDCPILTSKAAYNDYFSSDLRDEAMHDLGVGTTRKMKSVFSGIFFPSLRCKLYNPIERINIWRGKKLLNDAPVLKDVAKFNAFTDVPKLTIPIYFFGGKYDYTCAYSLQKDYFQAIQAPKKKFYTFQNSAHSPLYEESDRAIGIIERDVVE
ncbi:alpha/beta fold hydrolase [Enterococcus sp. DIV0187]|uniref:alpha/beta fold hydrolase n=1 Tax=Enterococcus sp. DIV0187 TaxID=2774644 RepID=UPI003F22123E